MSAQILLVDDDDRLLELYRTFLEENYTVTTAKSGAAALDCFDESIDVVLLDREMPEMSGEEVLSALRDRDASVRVSMVTGVEPTLEVLEMPFDAYLVKPFGGSELREHVETLLGRTEDDPDLRRTYALATKVGILESSNSTVGLESEPKYRELKAELRAYRSELEVLVDRLDDDTVNVAFESIVSGSPS